MSIFEHSRFRIFNIGQHPLKHTLSDFGYSNPALPGLTTLQSTVDWLVAVLYPRSQDAVATPADLPLIGNTILDYRVVLDDGDGKAASYRWEKREGDAAAKWYKIYDMDWGEGSILSAFLDRTQDLYVYKQGIDDLDSTGAVVTGTFAGQQIYGGQTAGTNLTLNANSGDGTGATSGYVQTADHFRPTAAGTLDLGTTALKFRTGYFGTSVLAGTLTAAAGSITDSSGAISFDNENLSTTGTLSAGAITGTSHIVGDTTYGDGAISRAIGTTFSFNALNVSTSGFFSGTTIKAGTLTAAAGSITDSSGSISFDNENLSTTGTLSAGATTATSFIVGNTTFTSGSIDRTVGTTFSFNALNVSTSGTLAAGDTTITGALVATTVKGGNLQLASNTLSSTNTDGDITLTPNGGGVVNFSCLIQPTIDASYNMGGVLKRFYDLFISHTISDGTNAISIANLLTFRAVGSPASGDALFWDGSKWVASAPDTEITHSTLSGLTTGDAGHTQFALLAGRSSGQTLNGGTAASENLILDSTAHATKGKILVKSAVAANTDASYSAGWAGTDLGGASNRFRNLYTAGEFFGLRLENLASDPITSAQSPGRLWWNTVTGYIGVDSGTAVSRVSLLRFSSDTAWDGSTLVKNVTVSGIDATQAIWQLKDNTNDYHVMDVDIRATTTTNVRITVNVALAAGSYRLIGLQ